MGHKGDVPVDGGEKDDTADRQDSIKRTRRRPTPKSSPMAEGVPPRPFDWSPVSSPPSSVTTISEGGNGGGRGTPRRRMLAASQVQLQTMIMRPDSPKQKDVRQRFGMSVVMLLASIFSIFLILFQYHTIDSLPWLGMGLRSLKLPVGQSTKNDLSLAATDLRRNEFEVGWTEEQTSTPPGKGRRLGSSTRAAGEGLPWNKLGGRSSGDGERRQEGSGGKPDDERREEGGGGNQQGGGEDSEVKDSEKVKVGLRKEREELRFPWKRAGEEGRSDGVICTGRLEMKDEPGAKVVDEDEPPVKKRLGKAGYLMVSANGGLNQMRGAICDMVGVAWLIDATLVVPDLDKTSFWADESDFADIFDVDHFIKTLASTVRIVKRLPMKLRMGKHLSLAPVSWSNASYYTQQIYPRLHETSALRLNKSDSRLANNDLPLTVQRLRCKTTFQALRFTESITVLGTELVRRLRKRSGRFVVLHLRYEKDMLAFTGCSIGCNEEEVKELLDMRMATAHWKEKDIDPVLKRTSGLCPMTPEEVALFLRAMGFEQSTTIYIAAGRIYGGDRRLRPLVEAFPNVVWKELLASQEELKPFKKHASKGAALDYLVSLEADVFVYTYDGNMARLVEGHRRYLGYKVTIIPDRQRLVHLIDGLRNKSLSYENFVTDVRKAHINNMGGPSPRLRLPGRPKEEGYFYSNPEECLCLPPSPSTTEQQA